MQQPSVTIGISALKIDFDYSFVLGECGEVKGNGSVKVDEKAGENEIRAEVEAYVSAKIQEFASSQGIVPDADGLPATMSINVTGESKIETRLEVGQNSRR